MTDERIAKWLGWMDGQIKNEILTMHLHRDTWEQVQEIVRSNASLPDSYWWEFMRDTYAATQAVAVRRQADTHRDAASLAKVIQEIREDSQRITRDFWIGLWDTDDRLMLIEANRGWTKNFGGGDTLDPAIPAADLDVLHAASVKVTDYVDRHLAHSDRRPIPASELPTVPDVHAAIETVGSLFTKYSNLLTASTWAFLVPVMQHDWQAVFRVPWIRSTPTDSDSQTTPAA